MRSHVLSALALVASLSLVGCGSDDGGSTTTDETDTGSSTSDTATTDTGSTPSDTGSTPSDTGSSDDTGSGGTDTGSGGTDTGADTTMTMAPTFTQVWGSILESRCRSCHSGGSPSGNLNMGTKANAYTNLVGKPAAGGACGGMGTRVIAGNAAMSILYTKVTTPTCGGRMPQGSGPLSMANTNMIRDWINAGALNN